MGQYVPNDNKKYIAVVRFEGRSIGATSYSVIYKE